MKFSNKRASQNQVFDLDTYELALAEAVLIKDVQGRFRNETNIKLVETRYL